jgi:hypothetical protein
MRKGDAAGGGYAIGTFSCGGAVVLSLLTGELLCSAGAEL